MEKSSCRTTGASLHAPLGLPRRRSGSCPRTAPTESVFGWPRRSMRSSTHAASIKNAAVTTWTFPIRSVPAQKILLPPLPPPLHPPFHCRAVLSRWIMTLAVPPLTGVTSRYLQVKYLSLMPGLMLIRTRPNSLTRRAAKNLNETTCP